MTATLNYSTREINLNFKIKVNAHKVSTLVGVKGFIEMVGDVDLCNRMLARAFNPHYNGDKMVCKLRRGLRVTFYYC